MAVVACRSPELSPKAQAAKRSRASQRNLESPFKEFFLGGLKGQIGVISGARLRKKAHKGLPGSITLDSKKLEYWPGTIYDGGPFFRFLGLKDSHIPTLWLLL